MESKPPSNDNCILIVSYKKWECCSEKISDFSKNLIFLSFFLFWLLIFKVFSWFTYFSCKITNILLLVPVSHQNDALHFFLLGPLQLGYLSVRSRPYLLMSPSWEFQLSPSCPAPDPCFCNSSDLGSLLFLCRKHIFTCFTTFEFAEQ